MKFAKLASPLAVAVILSLPLVGCRKGLDVTTKIPTGSRAAVGEQPAGPVDVGPGNRSSTTSTDGNPTATPFDPNKPIAQTGGWDGADENRSEFSAQTIYFDFDKSNVKPGEIKKLEEVASRMKSEFQGKGLRIEGHCDERGTEEYNRALGDRRALSVREKLVQLGLDPEIIPTITFGEEKPADSGHTDTAWSKNRRAELILLTKKQ